MKILLIAAMLFAAAALSVPLVARYNGLAWDPSVLRAELTESGDHDVLDALYDEDDDTEVSAVEDEETSTGAALSSSSASSRLPSELPRTGAGGGQ